MRAVLLGAVFLAAALASLRVGPIMIRRAPSKLIITNFRGSRIPAVGGVILASVLTGFFALAMAFDLWRPEVERFGRHFYGVAMVAIGLFFLGAVDDLGDAGAARGLGGHLRALMRGRITGGMIKAAGGLGLGLAAGILWEQTFVAAVIDAFIIALSANLLNLLDLRPGRAGKAFFLLWIPLAAFRSSDAFLAASVPVGGALSGWLPFDLKKRATLGDSGSNLLGGIVGAGIALDSSVTVKLAGLSLLFALNLLSEKVSFSSVIERTRPLMWLDNLGTTPKKSI